MSSLRFSHNLFKAAHGAITALACAMIAFVASAQPSNDFDKQRLRWVSKLPTDAAIPLVFGQSSNESFWIIDPTEPFSRRLLKELFRDGPQKLTGKVYIYLRPLQTTDERANQMAAYIWCSPDRAGRMKEVLSDDFSLPSKPNESCDTRAIQKILRNTSDLNSIPLGLHAQGIVRGAISVSRLADIERAFNLTAESGINLRTQAQTSAPQRVTNASSPNPACSSEEVFQLEVQDSYPYVTQLARLSLISKSPMKIVRTLGQSYGVDIDTGQEGTNIKGVKYKAGQVDWLFSNTIDKSGIDRYAAGLAKEIASYSTCSSPMCQGTREAYEKQLAWVKCHAGSTSSEGTQNGVAAEIDASKSRTAALKAANRDAAAREQEYRARLQRGEPGQSDTKPAGQMSAGMIPGQTNAANTASQMHSGSARDIGSNPRGVEAALAQEVNSCVQQIRTERQRDCNDPNGLLVQFENGCNKTITVKACAQRMNGKAMCGEYTLEPGKGTKYSHCYATGRFWYQARTQGSNMRFVPDNEVNFQ